MSDLLYIPILFFILASGQHTPIDHVSKGDTAGRNVTGCVLARAQNGDVVTARGTVTQEPHDMGFDIEGCDKTVLLTFAGQDDNQVSVSQLRQDRMFRKFETYTSAVYTSRGKSACIQCLKYSHIEAELTGILEVATMPLGSAKDKAGFIRDPSGRIIGQFGWGHPLPFAAFRLIIQSVDRVKAYRVPRPAQH